MLENMGSEPLWGLRYVRILCYIFFEYPLSGGSYLLRVLER